MIRNKTTWRLAAAAAIASIAVSACSTTQTPAASGDSTPQTTTSAPAVPGTTTPAPIPSPPPVPQDQAAAQGWKLIDAFTQPSPYGTDIKGDVQNIGTKTMTGLFTLVLKANGQEVTRTSGTANAVPPGATVPVTFVGMLTPLSSPGPYTYSLTVDGTF